MRKIIVVCLFLGLISCKSQEKKDTSFIDVSVEDFQRLISKEGVQLVDVRTPQEFNAGHIKNAKLIDFYNSSFDEQSAKILDKNKPVYLYCRSGGRSANAAKKYKEAGFTEVYNLLGGMNAWSAKNLKIEK
ncbi:rhodanese-like domain-containing protein [Polaribacter uvawellassae]|uniref:rhodanese-like domain-containing protein n=1 Tax=Polaribacter uvawellassae TaxID=3133495 RepID=UPI0032194F47